MVINMSASYRIPSAYGEAEFTEKRSRFISRIWPVETEQEALDKIRQTRERHWDATHNVYAYIIRDGATRYSDDGEPQGTAGMPVLEVLRHEELFDICCVVTRYFGGIELGTGGLVRAYSQSAKLGLEAAGTSVKAKWSLLDIPAPYSLLERVKLEIEAYRGSISSIDYAETVMFHALIPEGDTESFISKITDVSSGKISPEIKGTDYYAAKL